MAGIGLDTTSWRAAAVLTERSTEWHSHTQAKSKSRPSSSSCKSAGARFMPPLAAHQYCYLVNFLLVNYCLQRIDSLAVSVTHFYFLTGSTSASKFNTKPISAKLISNSLCRRAALFTMRTE